MISLARENAVQAGRGERGVPARDDRRDPAAGLACRCGDLRVLRPGGRLGVTDVIAADGTTLEQRAAAGQRTGCTTGTVTAADYRQQLRHAGFTQIVITPVNDAADTLYPAIVQAVKPAVS
jgi:hypothetical protein